MFRFEMVAVLVVRNGAELRSKRLRLGGCFGDCNRGKLEESGCWKRRKRAEGAETEGAEERSWAVAGPDGRLEPGRSGCWTWLGLRTVAG